jgi:biopolymer transport protein ExbD
MDEKEFDYMNVIPLVDVMLVLLTIVLTTSTFIATGAIPIDLPKAGKTAGKGEGMRLTIEIDQDGMAFWESKPVTLNQLKDILYLKDRSIPLVIRADKRLELQSFVDVVIITKNLAFTNVQLQTENRI